MACIGVCIAFQSTPPARGATTAFLFHALIVCISIHAPRKGSDGILI